MNWQAEIWSCYYCGSYNGNALYYCPHCMAKRKEEKRLNRPAIRYPPSGMCYYPKGGVSFRTPTYYYGPGGEPRGIWYQRPL